MNTRRIEHRYGYLRKLIDRRLEAVVGSHEPRDLMEGSRYVLHAPGKRIRSSLVILSCEAVGGQVKDALDAAVAIEMLHNFTLVHDDVMDNAPSRRGRTTVHIKWDVNNAILVGDTILGLAYRTLLQSTTNDIRRATRLFTDGVVDVCKGQAFDLEYEQRPHITLREYYRMIGKKTGKLITAATELGALLGNGTPKQIAALRTFGRHVGRAFQIQDDLLDVVADEKDLGKRIGGDICEGKKTFLLVKALESTRGKDNVLLRSLGTRRPGSISAGEQRGVVEEVTGIYVRCGAIEAARRQIRSETAAGIRSLSPLPASNARSTLRWMSEMLVQRTS